MGIKHKVLKSKLLDVNETNINLLNKLKDLTPSYAKHMLIANSIVDQMVKANIFDYSMLDLPMCPNCERPMLNHDEGGYCVQHGVFKKTKTFREYLAQDVIEFGFDTNTLELLDKICNNVDQDLFKEFLEGDVKL